MTEREINRKRLKKILIIFIIFFLAAIFYFNKFRVDLDPTTGGADAKTYYFLANQLIEKHIYAESWPDPIFRAWRPPLYPIFVAIWLWISGGNLRFVVFIQFVFLLGSGALVWYLYWLIFDSFYGGLVSSVSFLLYPPLHFYASYLYSETLFIFLLLLFLITAYKSMTSEKTGWFVLSGFVFSMSILVRTVNLPVLILSSVFIVLIVFLRVYQKTSLFVDTPFLTWRSQNTQNYFLRSIKKIALISTKNMVVFLCCSWFLIGIWTIRNYLVLDEFVLINTANNMNFYFGTRNDFYTDETSWHDRSWQVSAQRWTDEHEEVVNPLRAEFGEVGSSRKLSDIAISYIKQNPISYAAHKVHTLYRYLLPNLFFLGSPFESFFVVNDGTLIIYFFFFLSVVSSILSRNIRSKILLIFFLLLAISSSLSFFSERFVVVTTPLYLIFFVNGLFIAVNWLLQKFKLDRLV